MDGRKEGKGAECRPQRMRGGKGNKRKKEVLILTERDHWRKRKKGEHQRKGGRLAGFYAGRGKGKEQCQGD